jgi:hypothetical protein
VNRNLQIPFEKLELRSPEREKILGIILKWRKILNLIDLERQFFEDIKFELILGIPGFGGRY